MWKSGGIRERTEFDGTIKWWLIKCTRSEKILVKSGVAGDYCGVMTGCVKHPASGVFRDTNKDTRNALLKVPSTRGVSGGVRARLVTFTNGRTSKDAEMTDSGWCAKE